jgi:hypothetical protein
MKLWLRSGGICSFRGCSAKLNEHEVTFQESNFSNIAHIVAYKKDGARGDDPLPINLRNNYENLILVCTPCHHLVDSKEYAHLYSIELLKQFKLEHERKIEFIGELVSKGQKTQILRCRANILNEISQISIDQITQAIQPRYPISRRFIDIDMSRAHGDDSPEYWLSKKQEITSTIARILLPVGAEFEIDHLSVFAIGPMPLLMHLGNCLSNKITTDLFQRHRDTEDWVWKEVNESVDFIFEKIRHGTGEEVILFLNLSGNNQVSSLPVHLPANLNVYEVTLKDMKSTPVFLKTKKTLDKFKLFYREIIDHLKNEIGSVKKIHLFPAVPAPIAVICGRELIHKADPVLAVYDLNKNKNGFEFAMEVNNGR